jgi:hypothetical protein
MGNRVSKSPEVEALRSRLADMRRADVIELCEKADVPYSTVQKFRKRETGDINSAHYTTLLSALPAANDSQKAMA